MLAFLVSLVSVNALTALCTDYSAKSCSINNSKYLGTWYEIGRSAVIRNTFEKDCNCVKADYTLKPDGHNIAVANSCVNPATLTLNTTLGNAKILKNGFKVSFGGDTISGKIGQFFQNLIPGPNYIVSNVWVDDEGNYQRALVTYGKHLPPKFQFTWILSRDPVVGDLEVDEYLAYARSVGFNPVKAKFERTPCSSVERPLNP